MREPVIRSENIRAGGSLTHTHSADTFFSVLLLYVSLAWSVGRSLNVCWLLVRSATVVGYRRALQTTE